MQSDIRILEVTPYFSYERARTPLKFGAVVVEECLFCHVRTRVETRRGQVADGWGAMFLMDFWAFPSPAVPHTERERAMRLLTERYCRLVAGYPGYAHPVDIFLELEGELRRLNRAVSTELALAEPVPFLGALVSASPVDAALHDAFGKANGISSYDGYGPEHMAHDLGHYLGPAFRGQYISQYLRPRFLPELPVFHLVGGLDKLRRSEVTADDPQDGLPNSLDDWIARDGLRCLKVKLRGRDLTWDLERLLEVVAVAREAQARHGIRELWLTADTNEQCESPAYMVELLRRLRERDPAAYDALLYVEQPTERDLRAHRWDMRELAALKPVIVDESLTGLEDFDLAMELGWSGIALKACKGHSASLLFAARARAAGVPYTVQDLTNPGIALTHSAGLAARLYTLKGVEANSHQFFPRTSDPERTVHPGIFERRDGVLHTESLNGPGLGHRIEEIPREIFRSA